MEVGVGEVKGEVRGDGGNLYYVTTLWLFRSPARTVLMVGGKERREKVEGGG